MINNDENQSSEGESLDPANLARMLAGKIMKKVFVSKSEKEARLRLCRACVHFMEEHSQCGISKKYLPVKAEMANFHCDLNLIGEQPKW